MDDRTLLTTALIIVALLSTLSVGEGCDPGAGMNCDTHRAECPCDMPSAPICDPLNPGSDDRGCFGEGFDHSTGGGELICCQPPDVPGARACMVRMGEPCPPDFRVIPGEHVDPGNPSNCVGGGEMPNPLWCGEQHFEEPMGGDGAQIRIEPRLFREREPVEVCGILITLTGLPDRPPEAHFEIVHGDGGRESFMISLDPGMEHGYFHFGAVAIVKDRADVRVGEREIELKVHSRGDCRPFPPADAGAGVDRPPDDPCGRCNWDCEQPCEICKREGRGAECDGLCNGDRLRECIERDCSGVCGAGGDRPPDDPCARCNWDCEQPCEICKREGRGAECDGPCGHDFLKECMDRECVRVCVGEPAPIQHDDMSTGDRGDMERQGGGASGDVGRSNGEACAEDDECGSENCISGVCCIDGKQCCRTDKDCEEGKTCDTERSYCTGGSDAIEFAKEYWEIVAAVIGSLGAAAYYLNIVKRKTIGEEKVKVMRGKTMEGNAVKLGIKVKNDSTFKITEVKVTIDYPKAFKVQGGSPTVELGNIRPDEFQSAIFKLVPTRCVKGTVTGYTTYENNKGETKVVQIDPVDVGSVCPFLERVRLSPDEFAQRKPTLQSGNKSMAIRTDPNRIFEIIKGRFNNIHTVHEEVSPDGTGMLGEYSGQGAYSKAFIGAGVKVVYGDQPQVELSVYGEEEAMVTGLLSELVDLIEKEEGISEI